MKELKYTFEEFEEGVEYITNNVLALGNPFNRIVGVARGGLFLAARLSYKLGIPLTPITWSTRDNDEKESNLWLPEVINEGERVLLVDDIVDGGKTIKEILSDWESSIAEPLNKDNISVAVCYYNTAQDFIPDFWHKTIDRKKDDRWVNFWWEKK